MKQCLGFGPFYLCSVLVAKKKSLFDDRPVEIQELTYIITQDIQQLNGRIKTLEEYLKANGANIGNKQTQEHSSNVILSLQSKLVHASGSFKDVLELRQQVKRCILMLLFCRTCVLKKSEGINLAQVLRRYLQWQTVDKYSFYCILIC